MRNYTKGQPLNDCIITKEEFTDCADTINRLFSCELPVTYYTPFRIEKGERIQATGRLLNHYFDVKAQLREDIVINLKEAANAKNGSSYYASTKCIAFEGDYIHFLSVIYDVLKFCKYKLLY